VIDHSNIRSWLRGIDQNPNRLTWLVAADYFQEEGYEAFAECLRKAEDTETAKSMIRSRFVSFHPFNNAFAGNLQQSLKHLTPIGVAAIALNTPEFSRLKGSSGRLFPQVRCVPREMDGRHRREPFVVFRRPESRDLETTIVCPYKVQQPVPLYSTDEDRHVELTFHVGRWNEPDSPVYVSWPMRPTDIRITDHRLADLFIVFPTRNCSLEELPPEIWGDLFERPTPTQRELDDEVYRRVDGDLRMAMEYAALR
jgi:hypothetical protein